MSDCLGTSAVDREMPVNYKLFTDRHVDNIIVYLLQACQYTRDVLL